MVRAGIGRLRASSSSIANYLKAAPLLRRKALNSLSAVQDTYLSTKDIFERHKVVFTISTSIASVLTAWAGYTIRHLHESRVDQRLDSIEKTMKSNASYSMKEQEFKKLISGTVSFPAALATAGTSLIIGYGLGWRGGSWFARRRFRREQMKQLGQINPQRGPLKFLRRTLLERVKLLGQIRPQIGPLKFLRRPSIKSRSGSTSAVKTSEPLQKDAAVASAVKTSEPLRKDTAVASAVKTSEPLQKDAVVASVAELKK